MNSDDAILLGKAFAGGFCIASAIAYAYWCKARVFLFRQDLFEIRNRLWDAAKQRDAFSDPAYKRMREAINCCIDGAPVLSAPLFSLGMKNRNPVALNRLATLITESPIKDDIEIARTAFTQRIVQYVTRDHFFSGWLWLTARPKLTALVNEWIFSNGPEMVSDVEKKFHRHGHAYSS